MEHQIDVDNVTFYAGDRSKKDMIKTISWLDSHSSGPYAYEDFATVFSTAREMAETMVPALLKIRWD